jgi:L-threonylcarbamoyladenylate synthase
MGRSVGDAARALRAGALVVYPTDTLLGLAARAASRPAVLRLVSAKGRSGRQPLSVAVSSVEEIEPLASLTRPGRRWVRRHLPGPFTILVTPSSRARATLASAVAGGPALGLRVPAHPIARELARRAGPIVATSANRHGRPPASSPGAARVTFGAKVRVYLEGGPRPTGVPSVLVDLRGARPRARSRR